MSIASLQLNERVVEILQAACRVDRTRGRAWPADGCGGPGGGRLEALVHYYFTTRRELLRYAFGYAEERARDRVQAELERLPTGAEKLERFLLLYVDDESVFRENRALWNEAWSSMRLDEDLRPEVEGVYRGWVERLEELLEEGRADGSIGPHVVPADAALRLTAVADGLDSLMLLGLVERDRARAQVLRAIALELGS